MTRWPWITPLLVLSVAVSPPGNDILRGLSSSESISRDLSRFLLICGLAIAAALLLAEWGLRSFIARRRARARKTENASG